MKFSKLTKEERLRKISELANEGIRRMGSTPEQVDWKSPYSVMVHFRPELKNEYAFLQKLRNLMRKCFGDYEKADKVLITFIREIAEDKKVEDFKAVLLKRCKQPVSFMP